MGRGAGDAWLLEAMRCHAIVCKSVCSPNVKVCISNRAFFMGWTGICMGAQADFSLQDPARPTEALLPLVSYASQAARPSAPSSLFVRHPI